MDFVQKLARASRDNGSLLCVGLDPNPALMPVTDLFQFNREIIDATRDLVCAYKPNLAFYEALGTEGLTALERTVQHIPDSIPIIGDAKRGDISSSSEAYAQAMFGWLDFDAITVSPYLGYDSIAPFVEYQGKGVFILCKTSNPGSSDFQELECCLPGTGERQPLYRFVARKALEWNSRGNIGLVVGATYPEQLGEIRRLCPDLPLLIPGVGAQSGDLEAAVRSGVDRRGENAIINSSRQILYASRGKDFAQAARDQARRLRDEINLHRPRAG
ncbi:MAG: orotidine-5'-phosphate decarboxylase [Dehalococcoidia bacterium]|nr:orotidine-5'-phosphate decarboxylase [Dehalococcoidia bacterium]